MTATISTLRVCRPLLKLLRISPKIMLFTFSFFQPQKFNIANGMKLVRYGYDRRTWTTGHSPARCFDSPTIRRFGPGLSSMWNAD